jgi:hypothetical protein
MIVPYNTIHVPLHDRRIVVKPFMTLLLKRLLNSQNKIDDCSSSLCFWAKFILGILYPQVNGYE